jgi:hypothetical protein
VQRFSVQAGMKLLGRVARETANELPQHRLFYGFRGLPGREPFKFTFVLFRPFSGLALHLECEDMHGANNDASRRMAFFI